LKPYNQFLHQFGATDPLSCNPCTKKLLNFCIHQTHFNPGFVVFGSKQVEREREKLFLQRLHFMTFCWLLQDLFAQEA
jgi:hypothetical protein